MAAPAHYITSLATMPIFSDLGYDEIAGLAHRAPLRFYDAGTMLYTPEDPTEILFLLADGAVSRYHLATDGKMIISDKLLAGATFGEMLLLGHAMHGHFAQALTDCAVYEMRRNDVQRYLLSDPRIVNRVLIQIGQRVIDLEFQLQIISSMSVPQRLAATLLFVWNKLGQQPELPCTHEQLAGFINSTRATVTKTLNQFQEDGYIALQRRSITICDPEALRQITEG